MRKWIDWFFTIRHPSSDVQRRGHIALMIILGQMCINSLFVFPIVLRPSQALANTVLLLISFVSLIVAAFAIRRGAVSAGALITCSVSALAIGSSVFTRNSFAPSFLLILPLMIAGVTLPRRMIWFMLGSLLLELGVIATIFFRQVFISDEIGFLIGTIVLLVLATLISYTGARATDNALEETRIAEAHRQAAAEKLAVINASLEQRIRERTVQLEQALLVQREQAEALSASLDEITNLSVPIIPVLKDVLVVPIVGTLDAARGQIFTNRLLHAVEQQRARTVFLDLTGAAIVDARTAHVIVRSTLAAQLLGAKVILIGVRPDVAQELVALNMELSDIQTAASLDAGLRMLLNGAGALSVA